MAEVYRFLTDSGVFHAAPDPYDGLLELSEHETRTFAVVGLDQGDVVPSVHALFEPAVRENLLSVAFRMDPTGTHLLSIKAGSTVGFTSLTTPAGKRLFVRIRPKVSTPRVLELTQLSGKLPRWRRGDVQVAAEEEAPVIEWTLRAFEDAVQQLLAQGGLRSSHERVRADLRNRLRGRVLVARLASNLARGRPDLVPCEFPSLEVDNAPNRFLRWALRVAVVASEAAGLASLVRRFRIMDTHFAAVTLAEPRTGAITTETLPANMRHYKEALDLASFVVENIHLAGSPGHSPAVTVAVDMDRVFESAFFRGIRALEASAQPQTIWEMPLTIGEGGTGGSVARRARMKPDVWIPGTRGRLPIVADTKWKDVLADVATDDLLLGEDETRTIRLRNPDLYQIVTYAFECIRRVGRPNERAGCVAALVYPSLEDVPEFGTILNLGGARVDVRFLAWNLSKPATEGVRDVWTRLAAAASRGAQEIGQPAAH
jgi:5-methylcytosine-specific restriction endonuclease McrBC regulatory subunit McrC